MKICIIGGGLTGLTAAYTLSEGHEVTLLEKQTEIGGCLSSYKIGTTWVEKYYHHCFTTDTTLFALLEELDLGKNLEWLIGTTGSCIGSTIYPLNTLLEILRYPGMTVIDKARLALLTIRAKKLNAAGLDTIPAEEFITREIGARVYHSFFEPLLRSKFGKRRHEVSAAWLISRIAIRSHRGTQGERLGYLNGGFHQLTEALANAAKKRGCAICTGEGALSLKKVSGGWEINNAKYDHIVSTIPPQDLQKIGGPEIAAVPYQGAACLTVCLDRDVMNGIYWTNLADEAPYGAVVAHTNLVPRSRYGTDIVYLASYFGDEFPPGLEDRMLDDFCQRFIVKRNEVTWQSMATDLRAGPVFTTGYRNLIPRYEEKGLYMAGMFSRPNYPERSMEGAIVAGFEVSGLIGRGLSHESD